MRKYTRLLTTATAVGLSTSLATGIAVAAPADNAEINPETILGENFADIASTGEFSNLIDRIAKQAQDSQAFLDKLGGDLDSLFKGGDKDKDITAALEELRDVVNSLVTDFAPTESEAGESESTETGTQTGEESTEGAEDGTEDTETQPEGTEAGKGESTESGVDAGTQTGEDTNPKSEEGTSGSDESTDKTDKTDTDKKSDSAKELTWKIKVSDLASAYGDKEEVEGQQMVLIDIPEGVDPLSIKVTRDGRDIVVGTSEESTSIAVPAFSDQELEVTATVKDGETKNGVTSMPPKDIELSALALPVDKAGAIPKVDNTELSVLLNKAQQQGNVSIENIYITEDGDILVGPDKKPLDLSDAAVGTTGSIEDIATSIISGETKVSDANSQLKSFVAALATLSDKASPEQKEKAAEYLREVMKTREGEDSESTDKTDKTESEGDKSETDKDKTASDLDSLFEEGGIFSDLFGGGADKEDENESKATDKDDKSDEDKTDKSETDSDKTESEDETDNTDQTGEKRLIDDETAKLIKTGLLGAGATLLVSSLVKGLKEGNGLSSSADKTESKDAKDLTVEELLKLAGESEKTGEKTTESETRTTEREESTTPSTESERESTSRASEPREDSQSGVATEPTDTGSTGTTSGTTSGSSNTGSTGSRSGSASNTGGSAGSAGSDGYSEGYNDGYDDAAADGAEQPASPAEADYNNAAAESMPVTGMDSSTKILAGLAVALMVAAGAFIGIARRKTD